MQITPDDLFFHEMLNLGVGVLLGIVLGTILGYWAGRQHRACPHCDKTISVKATVCPKCRTAIAPEASAGKAAGG